MIHRSSRSRSVAGFSLAEMLVVVAVVAMLASVAMPKLLGAREEALHGACLDAFHVLDGEVTSQLEILVGEHSEAPAEVAIDLAIDRLAEWDHVSNPRHLAAVAYERVEGPAFVPPPDSSCRVFAFDATGPEENAVPTIVITHYERGVKSFRISLD